MYGTKGLGVAYQDIVSAPALPLFFRPASLLFLSSSLRFFAVAYGASRESGVLRLSSIFPYLSRPPHRALCAAPVSRVKLCAISLTFDNRCSSGNYILSVLAANLLFHFNLPLFFVPAHPRALIIRLPPTDLQM